MSAVGRQFLDMERCTLESVVRTKADSADYYSLWIHVLVIERPVPIDFQGELV
jgi:hypothetical protein